MRHESGGLESESTRGFNSPTSCTYYEIHEKKNILSFSSLKTCFFFKGTKKYFETVSFVVVLVNRCEPPYAAARLLDTHDTQMLLVPLLEERPWARRRKVSGSAAAGGNKPITEIFADGRWTEQAEQNRL